MGWLIYVQSTRIGEAFEALIWMLWMRQGSIIGPNLFKRLTSFNHLEVFVCGPGFGTSGFNLREKVRKIIIKNHNVRVVYGEDLVDMARDIPRGKGDDLQTLEAKYAHIADFTVLLLDSPGAIAELGTFSMIPSLVPRIFIIVPAAFFRAESYIARGPLSIVSKYSKSNIFYYENGDDAGLSSFLKIPVSFFKFSRNYHSYKSMIGYDFIKNFESNKYINNIDVIKGDFLDLFILLSIVIVEDVDFSGLVACTGFSPEEVSRGLKGLYNKKDSLGKPLISKIKGRYYSGLSIDSREFSLLDAKKVSHLRARLIAGG